MLPNFNIDLTCAAHVKLRLCYTKIKLRKEVLRRHNIVLLLFVEEITSIHRNLYIKTIYFSLCLKDIYFEVTNLKSIRNTKFHH